jgi:hypothetical protein
MFQGMTDTDFHVHKLRLHEQLAISEKRHALAHMNDVPVSQPSLLNRLRFRLTILPVRRTLARQG